MGLGRHVGEVGRGGKLHVGGHSAGCRRGRGVWLGCGEEAGRAPHPLFTPGVLRTENTPFSYSMFWGSPGKGAGQLVAELGAAGERLCWELL